MRAKKLWILLWFVAPSIAAARVVEPLDRFERQAIYSARQDTLDKAKCIGTKRRVMLHCRDRVHYVRMNEWHHNIWQPYIRDLGGAYVGVGADQGLTFIAWARSELGFMIDYDPVVVRVNRIHRALILHSRDRLSYLQRWSELGKRSSLKILRTEYAERGDYRQIVSDFKTYRRSLHRHLVTMFKLGRWRNLHWLASASDYRFLREMFLTDRIRIMAGDLLKQTTLREIGRATRQLGVPVRVLYTSNAEEFWPYVDAFRRNVVALPMDRQSVVLRTRHTKRYGPRVGEYIYVVQAGRDFQRSLLEPATVGVRSILAGRRAKRPGLLTVGVPLLPRRPGVIGPTASLR
ncbi:MAG: hypothetical protein H6707_05935 [Deltaproteobacteria bacterium]|nr:hypothetical protein [Deltaproteobacteria bacterium]